MPTADESQDETTFRRPREARRSLERLKAALPSEAVRILRRLLVDCPDPDDALAGIDDYVNKTDETTPFSTTPQRLSTVVRLFSHSRYLKETLVRHPELLDWCLEDEHLHRLSSAAELRAELGWLSPLSDEKAAARTLARFRRMQLLRIGARDILGLATLAEVTLELSNLADAVLQGALDYLQQKLSSRFGRALTAADTGPMKSEMVVLALGKLGGRELNYSSDIDLMFVYTDDGLTAGPIAITNKEYFTQVANGLTVLVSQITPEGSCYRVDLRLRPEGSAGEVALPVKAAIDYYHQRARDWELQMLIKARPAAGAAKLAQLLLRAVQPLIYQTSTDFSTIERVAETRDRIHQKLRGQSAGGVNVKLAKGGIRDIEFMVQCLQRLYGGRDPWLQSGGTLFALHRLREKGYLSMPDYARLAEAYQYLRTLEHRLQIDENRQTHSMPQEPGQLEILARRMRDILAPRSEPRSIATELGTRLKRVAEIYDRVVYSQEPARTVSLPDMADTEEDSFEVEAQPSLQSQIRHLERHTPRLAEAVRALPIRRGSKHFEHLLNKLVAMPLLWAEFENSTPLLACVADLFENSPYLAEHLIRHPEDIERLKAVAEKPVAGDRPREVGLIDAPKPAWVTRPDVEEMVNNRSPVSEKADWLRRFYRHEMLRILAESIYQRHPIFESLAETSRLAEWVIQAAYRFAVDSVFGDQRPAADAPGMQIVALGRLGIGEFDLGSDADLVFVLDDEALDERLRWRRVAEQLIEITSSYTREGFIFAVDPRLRPLGRDGELVQTESRYKQYHAETAEAWEAITYMKARTIAGDIDRGTRFLSALQDIGWKRYGMDTSLARLLVEMRERIEKEQGSSHLIKAAAGGYYDIDFILMFLRLKNAGQFFESLNTPQRIAVIRATGSLDDAQTDALHRNAVFFRSLDHACRVMSGHSTSGIPTALVQRSIVRELTARWSGFSGAGESLAARLHQVRTETRELFSTILGAG
ncbi:MAG: glutamine-synthetase adenylyltransferase [Acidobacteria bacterium]|nr:glutamine-synthetase adenylyltransferase [Acidobacteriota bacterium]